MKLFRRHRALLLAIVGGPVFALIEEPQRGWGDPLILVPLAGGVVLFGLFVLWESRATQPKSEERRVGKEGRSRWAPYH